MTTENKMPELEENEMPELEENGMPELVTINDVDEQTKLIMTLYFVRHENRFLHGLADCSLTNEGIFSSKNELPGKFNMNVDDNKVTINNIYCSPLLRTVQTIYPTARLLGKQIKLEESLYELVNSWTSHYTVFANSDKKLPMIDHNIKSIISLYFIQFNFLFKIKNRLETLPRDNPLAKTWDEWIKINQTHDSEEKSIIQAYINVLIELKSNLDLFLVMINDDRYTYVTKNIRKYIHDDPNISSAIQNITNCIIFIEGMIVCKIPNLSTLIEIGEKLSPRSTGLPTVNPYAVCLSFIDESLKLLGLYNLSEALDTGYESIINVSNFVKGRESESYTDSLERSQPIVHKMLNSPEYQNSIYVSHQSIINAIFVTMFKIMFNNDALDKLISVFNSINSSETIFNSFEDFCENNHIVAGAVYKVLINPAKNNIFVEKY